MQPLHSGIISIHGSQKTWTWKQSPTLASKITDKSQKCAQSGSQETPQITQKSIKWTPCACWVSLWTPESQNSHSGYPKWSLKVSQMPVLGIKCYDFSEKYIVNTYDCHNCSKAYNKVGTMMPNATTMAPQGHLGTLLVTTLMQLYRTSYFLWKHIFVTRVRGRHVQDMSLPNWTLGADEKTRLEHVLQKCRQLRNN